MDRPGAQPRVTGKLMRDLMEAFREAGPRDIILPTLCHPQVGLPVLRQWPRADSGEVDNFKGEY